MDIKVRVDDRNASHVRATLFVNGANAGQVCLRNGEEFAKFCEVLQDGTYRPGDEFVLEDLVEFKVKPIPVTFKLKEAIESDDSVSRDVVRRYGEAVARDMDKRMFAALAAPAGVLPQCPICKNTVGVVLDPAAGHYEVSCEQCGVKTTIDQRVIRDAPNDRAVGERVLADFEKAAALLPGYPEDDYEIPF